MAVTDEPFHVELDGRDCGRGVIRESDCGWTFGWERPDGIVTHGGPFDSAETAGERLMDCVTGWYAGLQ